MGPNPKRDSTGPSYHPREDTKRYEPKKLVIVVPPQLQKTQTIG